MGIKKILPVIVAFVMILSISSINVFAEKTTQNGLEVTLLTDKTDYSSTEDIVATLTVKNTNEVEVSNILLENVTPEGYKVIDKNSLTKEISKLNSGESVSLKVTYLSNASVPEKIESTETKTEAVENTGASESKIISDVTGSTYDGTPKSSTDTTSVKTGTSSIIALVCILILAISVVILFVVKKKKYKQVLSITLVCALMAGYTVIGEANVKAFEVEDNIKISTTVNVDNKPLLICGNIIYNYFDDYLITFETDGGTKIEPQKVKPNDVAIKPDNPKKDGYDFAGWYLDPKFEKFFSFKTVITSDLTLYALWIDSNDTTDSDSDGLYDYMEFLIGTDKYNPDTDGDGLSDNFEIMGTATNPLSKDSNKNGINDGEEDNDNDGLSNAEEEKLGTNPESKDSDEDNISDYEEVKKLSTKPSQRDTDSDGVSDGKEIAIGTNPLKAEKSFKITQKSNKKDTVVAGVNVTLSGNQVETLSVEKNNNKLLFSSEIPGCIGGAYEFSVDGTFENAELSFEFDEDLLNQENFDPVIYYFNEEKQQLEPLDTTIVGNTAYANTTHFSTYILMNRTVYEESFQWMDYWDSNKFTSLEIVFVIDDSGSMYYNDDTNQRLTVAQNLIDKLPTNSKIGVVKFESLTSILTNELTEDRELAKSYLTTSYFKTSGGTSMYRAINDSFSLFNENADDSVLKIMVVLSDGETWDTHLHSSVVESANENKVKIYSVGLGSSTTYFIKYLNPLSNNTGGEFYLSSNAEKLSEIYKDIGNRIDIETDSDGDGIPDYYEDNMIIFNGIKIPLDKNNPDTDGDGLLDSEEVTLLYEYNSDNTKVKVTGFLKSDPSSIDSDNDGLYDNLARYVNGDKVAPKDPAPLIANAKPGVWDNYVFNYENNRIPRNYKSGVSGLNIGDYLDENLCDFVVSLVARLDKPITENENIFREIAALFRIGYLLGNSMFEGLDRITNIGEIDEICGAYILNFIPDEYDIAYHSQPNTWQRKLGYNSFYDTFFRVGSKMVTSKDLRFEVRDTTYALWMWKGDYWNMHSGAEIGLYEIPTSELSLDNSSMNLYKCVDFNLPMSLSLFYYDKETEISKNVFNWNPIKPQFWVTGFNTSSEFELPWDQYMISIGKIDFTQYSIDYSQPYMNNKLMFDSLKKSTELDNKDYSKYFIFDEEDGKNILWIMWDQEKTDDT